MKRSLEVILENTKNVVYCQYSLRAKGDIKMLRRVSSCCNL